MSEELLDEAPVEETVDALEVETDEAADAVESLDDEAPAEAVAPEPPVAPTLEPFTFNAFKQPYEVPGLKFDAVRNAIIADDPRALERMKQMLSSGREWEARGRQELVQLRRELQQTREQPAPELEHAKAFTGALEQAMQIPNDEDYLRAMLELRQQWPLLQAKAERSYAERLMQHAQAAQQPPEPDVEVVEQEAKQGAEALVSEILTNQPWASPDVAAELTEYLQDPAIMNQWVLRANRDLPDIGVRKGQYVADWDRARTLAEKLTKPYQRAFTQTAQVQKTAAQTTKIAAQNAATLAQGKPLANAKRPIAAPNATRPDQPRMTTEEIRAKIDRDMERAWHEMRR